MSFNRYPYLSTPAPKPQPAKPFDRFAFLWKPKSCIDPAQINSSDKVPAFPTGGTMQ